MFHVVQKAYLAFRKSHRGLLNSARRQMPEGQRAIIDGVAATAFQAGFRAGQAKQDQPIPQAKLKPWTIPKPKTDEPPATP